MNQFDIKNYLTESTKEEEEIERQWRGGLARRQPQLGLSQHCGRRQDQLPASGGGAHAAREVAGALEVD